METTKLWQRTLAAPDKIIHREHRERLRSTLRFFREKAGILAEEIPRDLPALTDHSVRHLDALWEIASLLTEKVEFNPLEAFVFGGAVLLHDLANCVAAFPNGLADLQDEEWIDMVYAAYRKAFGRIPTDKEVQQPDESILHDILLIRLRSAHAEQAEKLAALGFYHRSQDMDCVERTHLISDEEIREKLGLLIGKIAHSHHWDIDKVEDEFGGELFPAPPPFPSEWIVDPLKVAVVLRAADAAQIDSRRAPSLVFALRQPKGESFKHWNFQNHLNRPLVEKERLVYHAYKPFKATEADSWWLCFDVLGLIHKELSQVDDVLLRRRNFRLAARGVMDHDSIENTQKRIKVDSWVPIDARVTINDVTGVVERLGGAKLYGDNQHVPLRELISNAADAVRARRAMRPSWNSGCILVSLLKDSDGHWLEVEDNGIGMTVPVMSGPLLQFGTSYWVSPLCREEHPGLFASGFVPTGEFGIGFFSIFMLGDYVQVISKPLPRWGRTELVCHVLEFKQGPRPRPLIREASRKEWLDEPGTRIRVLLRENSFDGLLGKSLNIADIVDFMCSNSGGLKKNDVYLMKRFNRLVSRLAPCLDVDIKTKACDEEPAQIAVAANDWQTIDFDVLVQRVMKDVSSSGSSILIINNGQPVARIGLPGGKGAATRAVVGGFATDAGIPGFPGVVLGHKPDLARRTAEPLPFNISQLREWLVEVESELAERTDKWNGGPWYATAYLEAGVRPRKLKCFLYKQRWLSVEDMESENLPSDLIIALSEEFSCANINIRFNEAHNHQLLCLDNNVVLAPAISAGMVSRKDIKYPEWNREILSGFVSRDNKPFPWSLPLLCAEAIAKNWGLNVEAILPPPWRGGGGLEVEFRCRIGLYAGSEEVEDTVIRLIRKT